MLATADHPQFVLAVFENATSAGFAVDGVHRHGVALQDIGTATRAGLDIASLSPNDSETANAAGRGMTAGAALGIGVGALATVLLPGIGGLLVTGVLASAAGFGFAGAAVGGLVGALGNGDDATDAALDRLFAHGTVLVAVKTTDTDGTIARLLKDSGGTDVRLTDHSPIPATVTDD